MKGILLLINGLLFVFVSYAQTSIEGIVLDEQTSSSVAYAAIQIEDSKSGLIRSSVSNPEGYYSFSNLPDGTYDMMISYLSKTHVISGISVSKSNVTTVNPKINTLIIIGEDWEWQAYYADLFDPHEPISKKATGDELKMAPVLSPIEYLMTISGTAETSNGQISFRGARPQASAYYVDGMRIWGNLDIPMSSIEYMNTYTSGIPAKYGDATGAIIVIETKSYYTD